MRVPPAPVCTATATSIRAYTDSVDAAASRQVAVPHPRFGATQPVPKGLVRRMSFGSSVSAASSAIAIASPVSSPK